MSQAMKGTHRWRGGPLGALLRSLSGPAVLLAVAGVGGCASGPAYSPSDPAPWDPESVGFAHELGVDLSAMQRLPTGLYVEDLTVGDGGMAHGTSLVTLHYVGYLPDGTVIDTSSGGAPIQFRLGGNEVIRGWNQGIAGMRRGGIRRLVVRPSLGYGARGRAPVPPNATLVFDVQLLDVR